MIAWALAFALTCALELLVVFRLAAPRPGRLRIALCAQAATHPLVWIAMATLPGSQLGRLVCVELCATGAEAIIYARFLRLPRIDAFAISATANAASLLVVAAVAGVAQALA